MGRLTFLLALVVLLDACQLGATAPPAPSASPTPHTPPTVAVLMPSDVQPPLEHCSNSGSITSYLAALGAVSPDLATKVSSQWQALKKLGATDAAIALFTADPAACSAELAASGSVKSEASFVAQFVDEGAADRAWQAGVLGFAPPNLGELPPGVTRGAGTGLGDSSWTFDRAPVRLASWRKSVFVALVVVTNLDAGVMAAATAAVDPRLT